MSPAVAPPDPFDADLSALHTHVDNLGPWLAIWSARTEPDAHARRCANDAMDAIDAALAGLHGHPRPAGRRDPPGRRRHGGQG